MSDLIYLHEVDLGPAMVEAEIFAMVRRNGMDDRMKAILQLARNREADSNRAVRSMQLAEGANPLEYKSQKAGEASAYEEFFCALLAAVTGPEPQGDGEEGEA